MNSITPNSITIDHDFIDKSGKKYSGFIGLFQRIGQTEPTVMQREILLQATIENKMICFGSVDEVVKVLNESR